MGKHDNLETSEVFQVFRHLIANQQNLDPLSLAIETNEMAQTLLERAKNIPEDNWQELESFDRITRTVLHQAINLMNLAEQLNKGLEPKERKEVIWAPFVVQAKTTNQGQSAHIAIKQWWMYKANLNVATTTAQAKRNNGWADHKVCPTYPLCQRHLKKIQYIHYEKYNFVRH